MIHLQIEGTFKDIGSLSNGLHYLWIQCFKVSGRYPTFLISTLHNTKKKMLKCTQIVVSIVHKILPLTGRSESVGKRQLQLASYQSLEHLEQILSRPPEDEEINTVEHQCSPNQIHAKCLGSICIFKIKLTDTTNNPGHVQ